MIKKPILFNTEMVQAILAGRKKQTRRVINHKGILPCGEWLGEIKEGGDWCSNSRKDVLWTGFRSDFGADTYFMCPYKIGDILWVRETWAFIDNLNAGVGDDQYYEYKADTNNPLPGEWPLEEKGGTCLRWKPSIHMPKEAARLFLKVTDVRVEKLLDISEEQAIKEGFSDKFMFMAFWDDIYGNALRNPWVWVIEFSIEEVKGEA